MPVAVKQKMVEVIQINVKPIVEEKVIKARPGGKEEILKTLKKEGKRYFCTTPEEQLIFTENNPGVETETFMVELAESAARKYLNDPENRKQFTRKKQE